MSTMLIRLISITMISEPFPSFIPLILLLPILLLHCFSPFLSYLTVDGQLATEILDMALQATAGWLKQSQLKLNLMKMEVLYPAPDPKWGV